MSVCCMSHISKLCESCLTSLENNHNDTAVDLYLL